MFVSSHPTGTVVGGRGRSRSPETAPGRVAAAFRARRAQIVRNFWQLLGLAWVTVAILVYPVVQSGREHDARRLIRQLGGRFHVGDSALARVLPSRLRRCGALDSLNAIRSINLSNCDVTDADLDKLMRLKSLQQINLCGCPRVTTNAVAKLKALPQMKLVWVDGMRVEEAGRYLTGEANLGGILAKIGSVFDR